MEADNIFCLNCSTHRDGRNILNLKNIFGNYVVSDFIFCFIYCLLLNFRLDIGEADREINELLNELNELSKEDEKLLWCIFDYFISFSPLIIDRPPYFVPLFQFRWKYIIQFNFGSFMLNNTEWVTTTQLRRYYFIENY